MSNSRRSFCKNAVFIGLGLSFSPLITYARGNQPTEKKVLSLKKRAGKFVTISGKVCYEDQTPVKNAMIEIWHDNSESEPLKFEYKGKLMTDAEGNYSFETDFPGNHFETGAYRMRRIFFKVNGNKGKELLTKLYFGASGKAFVDGTHVGNTHQNFRAELPKTREENENHLKILFNVYLNH